MLHKFLFGRGLPFENVEVVVPLIFPLSALHGRRLLEEEFGHEGVGRFLIHEVRQPGLEICSGVRVLARANSL